jgi:ubiquitin
METSPNRSLRRIEQQANEKSRHQHYQATSNVQNTFQHADQSPKPEDRSLKASRPDVSPTLRIPFIVDAS